MSSVEVCNRLSEHDRAAHVPLGLEWYDAERTATVHPVTTCRPLNSRKSQDKPDPAYRGVPREPGM